MDTKTLRPGVAVVGCEHRASETTQNSEARASRPASAGPGLAAIFLSISTLLFAIVPSDLRESDPLSEALYHHESFEGEQAIVPNVPQFARTMILERLQNDPSNPVFYRALAEVEMQLLDETQAETHMKQFVEVSTDKDNAFFKLEDFFHSRTRFEDEFKTMLNHAHALTPKRTDPDSNAGPYLHYHRALTQIQNYGLKQDPELIYRTIVETYPESQKPLFDLLEFERVSHDNERALEILEQFHQKFPDQNKTYLLKKASLLDPQKAFELLNTSYDPLWDIDLARELDQSSIRAGKKGEYLAALKDKLEKQSLDLDSVTRLFHSYYFAGNTIEATSILNDYRLLKEKSVQEKKSRWEPDELWIMAQLHHRILNLNEAARFYYAVYGAESQKLEPVRYNSVTADDALNGLFQILITAEERPIQLGAGNLDLYKDIATADANPGVLNGILSLILNGTHPNSEFEQQETKAIGYFNRAQASAILRLIQKDYPASKHLPRMYKDVLKIYLKYGMDDLIIKTGENFFKAFPESDEILEIGVAVTDAYARKQDHTHEWQTYEYLLPIAAKRDPNEIVPQQSEPQTDAENEDEYQDEPPAKTESAYSYAALLKRYISSLTQEKNYNAALTLYRDQIQKYPTEEALYENFAEYLAQNNLFDEEASIYSHAIQQFKTKSWYEKLARWYLRREQSSELEKLSHEVIDTFQGTEVAQYLQNVNTTYPYRSLYIALNQYALSRFPYNMTFVNNLLRMYSEYNYYNWEEYEKLCRQYYFLDESIRSRYLYRLAEQRQLKQKQNPSSNPDKLFAADKEIWRAHFQESLPLYDDLAKQYPSDQWLNTRVADLKRSLGWQHPSYYKESAQLREYLAKVAPTDSSLWTTAGETLAEIEDYSAAKQYWENILKIDPQNSERYLEVATILWDYYLFDDALNVIQRARSLKDSDSLFAYEAGAIYESKRDYQTAVAEYSKSLVDASEEARNRLNQLYRRPKLATLIRTHLEKQLQQNPQDANLWLGVIAFYSDQKEKDVVRELITRAVTTLKPENFAEAVNSLNETARNFGLDSLQESLIQKRIQYASTDLEKITVSLELVSFYDSRGQKEKAESVLLALYQQQKASAGLIQELISFYSRNGNYNKAFGIYDASLQIANSKYHKQYLREIVDRYRERKNYDRALAAVAELRKEDPLNGDLFRIVSEIYAEQGNYPAMVQHYRDGLQMVRDSKMSEDEKKQQIAVMRKGIIQANLILKDYTAALDQYIELLNRDAENEALLSEAAFFASRYEISPRLFDYYNKTAAASPKDHRWPMLLGRLHLYSSNPEAAIDQFRTAIAIRPERVDLHQSLADAYQRSGKYPEVLQEYDRLYALTYKDSRWLSSMAELNARLGNQKKALEFCEQYLADRKPMERDFEMAKKCLNWGMSKSAIAYGNAGLKKFQTDLKQWIPPEGFAAYIEALVQNNSSATALELMHQTLNRIDVAKKKATFDAEALRSVEYMVQDAMVRVLPSLVKKYSTGDELNVLESKLLALNAVSNNEQRSKRLLPFAQAAGLAKSEEQLLRQLVHEGYDSSTSHYSTNRENLRRFYLDRHEYAACAKFLEAEWRKYRHHADYRNELLQVAEAYRLAGLHDNELVILREYYAFGRNTALEAEPVERYLTLLYEKNLREELKSSAVTADLTAANFFVKRRDRELATLAIESLSKTQDPVWKTIHLAMLGKELGINEPGVKELFVAGLDLRTIGESIDTRGDSTSSLLGDDWFFYGTRYGEYLWNIHADDAPYYLVADLEGAPLRSERQDQLGSWYLNTAKLNEPALNHFELAAELDPKNPNYQDHIAEALYANGKKDEAIALWKSLLAAQTPSNYLLVCEAASNHDFMSVVDADIEKYLTTQIGKYGAAGLNDLIETYLENVPAEKRKALLPRWITAAPAPKEFSSALLEISALDQDDRTLVYIQTANYLKTWMRSAAGNEIEVARNQWVIWNYLAASEYLENKQYQLTNEVTKEALDELKRISETNTPRVQKLTLLHAQSLLRLEKTDEAVDLLGKYVHGDITDPAQLESAAIDDEKYLKVNELLRDEGHPAEAALILEEMYQRKLLAGVTDSSIFIGLAQIRLDQNKNHEALQYLNRMIYSSPENLDNFHLAAELLEKNKQFTEALNLRNELKKRKSWDEANLIQIAEDLSATGNAKDAAIIAKTVLQSEQSTLNYQVRAAKVFSTSSAGLAGKLEMQQIEKAMRTKTSTIKPPIYYSSLRQVLIEHNPNLDLLLSEKFVNPHSSNLKAPLFRGYRKTGLCEQALQALDPGNLSSRNYEEEEEYSDRYGYNEDPFYDSDEYDQTDNYPINELNLTDEESIDLALQAADCAANIDDSIRQIFFLNIAFDHAEAGSKKEEEIQKMIDKAEAAASEKAEVEAARWKVQSNLGRQS
jgi:cellulose synthase operon protein C